MVIEQKAISAADFWEFVQLPGYAEAVLELVDGEIIEMPKPGGRHGIITMTIGRLIGNFVAGNDLGYITAAETGYILVHNPDGRDTVRGLDVGYISKARLPEGIPDKHIPIAPDLAVEVISPGNMAEDIHNKTLELLAAGTQIIWLVYPDSQTVDVRTQDGAKTYKLDDTLDASPVLDGFSLSVKAIFS